MEGKQPTSAELRALALKKQVTQFRALSDNLSVLDFMREWQNGFIIREHEAGLYAYELPEREMVPLTTPVPHLQNKVIRKSCFSFTTDKAFAEVLDACSLPRTRVVAGFPSNKPWIKDRLRNLLLAANSKMHRLTHPANCARSIEAWQAGKLVGGAIMLHIGGAVIPLSIFHTADNAGNATGLALQKILIAHDFSLHDSGEPSNFSTYLGGVTRPAELVSKLRRAAVSETRFFPALRDPVALDEILLQSPSAPDRRSLPKGALQSTQPR